jgi:transposase
MAILFVGIDLAKSFFAVHGANEAGKPELVRPSVPRNKLLELVAALPPCTIGMEASSGAHHWARLFQTLGHTVRLMAPKFVAPYRLSGKRGKNDAADAQAICEAVQRPNMRFVPVKSAAQQGQLMVHRARHGFVEARTATLNRIRGLLSEVTRLDERIAQYDRHVALMARRNTQAQQLQRLRGIGETTATALIAILNCRVTARVDASRLERKRAKADKAEHARPRQSRPATQMRTVGPQEPRASCISVCSR